MRADLRRVLTAIVGGLLTLIGVALLVLPGPGFVVIAAGLAVLAREFEWAQRPLRIAADRGRDGLDLVARKLRYAVVDALAGLALMTIAVVDLVANLPYLEPLSDGFLLLGGLFLVGTVVYARTTWAPRVG